jgi:hypothetical protein
VAEAATDFPVTTTADAGPGSLRQAVLDANANTGADTISFSSAVTGTITLTTGELLISDPVSINGPGARVLTVSGNDIARVFDVNNTAAPTTISGLTVTKGRTSASGDGAGIYSQSDLNLHDVTITGNNSGRRGGGLDSYSSALNIDHSTISGNTAVSTGGGIGKYQSGLSIADSTIAGNTSTNSRGGGLYLYSVGSTATPATITGSTIVGNQATSAANGRGGGLYAYFGVLHLQNTILAGNTAAKSGPDEATYNGNVTLAFSFLGSPFGGVVYDAPPGGTNIIGGDPKLGPLQNNGGATDTRAPAQDSPVVDRGSAFGLTTDQRGFPRTFDVPWLGNAAGGDGTDIGAVELGGGAFPPSVAALQPKTGPAGTPVVITGNNLTGATQVLFGTKPASAVKVNGNNQIVATAPAGAGGTVDVRVVTPRGTSAPAAGDKFTYAPTITKKGKAKAKRKGSSVVVTPGITVICPPGGPTCIAKLNGKVGGSKVGGSTAKVKAGKKGSLKFKLSSKATSALRAAGKLKITVNASARAGSGLQVKTTKKITIKR